ncbi:MAG: hypothetical protein BWY47_00131 [Bacteroidetes bacterium ADurb.Bin302]|nr:MAG: hypothetical protein BWY47_00131 [Bacteroidetes bacterium ADurb.Bin302]
MDPVPVSEPIIFPTCVPIFTFPVAIYMPVNGLEV